MPTHEETTTFEPNSRLTREQRERFLAVLRLFVDDLAAIEAGERSTFRRSLRIKGYQGAPGVMELTWDGDGRALWRFGDPVEDGLRHVQWLRVGTHDIF